MRSSLFLPTTLAFSALLAACGDDVTDPAGLLDAEQAEAVMRSAETLPLLPRLIDGVATVAEPERATLLRARELWASGAVGEDPRGRVRRRIATRYALPVLLAHVPDAEWRAARTHAGDWVGSARGMLRHLSVPSVERRLDAAAHHLDAFDRAADRDDRAHHLLLAGSELVETTPAWVARSMTRDAVESLQRAEREHGGSGADLERAERLKDWAVRAVAEGEYLLAIQRAYYAIQLAEAL